MTENLLQKLEEKVIALLTELEASRNEANALKLENFSLRAEKMNSSKKLQELVALLDTSEVLFQPSNVVEMSEGVAV